MPTENKRDTTLPPGFVARMGRLLPPDELAAFLAAFDGAPRVGLRVNTLKISLPDFINIAPFSLAPVGDWEPAGFLVTDNSRPGRHPYHDAGLYYLQEPSAMVAGALLAPVAGERVLDLAAAPGGKATHLASRIAAPTPLGRPLRQALDDEGLLVANDVHAGRARLLADNLARWGASNVLITSAEPERVAAALGPVFDRVLMDAPCSGEGMFRRHEEVEWSEAIVAACARRQRGILESAPGLVRPGGRLLYATCTFAPEEDEQVIAAFLGGGGDWEIGDWEMVEPGRFAGFDRGRPDWAAESPAAAELSHAVRLWPHRFPGEGHFLAIMERAAQPDAGESPRPFRPRPPAAAEMRLWQEFAVAVGLDLPAERLNVHDNRLYLLPRAAIDPGRLRIVRYGLHLGEFRPGRFHPAHDLALSLGAGEVTAAVSWTAGDPRLAAYLAGSDLPGSELPDAGSDGWVLVAVDGFGLGWAKRAGGRLKNHYPHHLRRAAV